MSKTSSLLNIPSIQNIIVEEKTSNFDKQVKQFFRLQQYPTFPINDLLGHSNYSSDQRFYILLKELQNWNKRVEKNQIQRNAKAQLYRNKFLFSSLKSIMVQSSKGTPNYETNINKLYEWWRKNSKDQISMYFSSNKRSKLQDEDWQVRRTFKSNMPQEIKNYQRRMMVTSQEDYNRFYSNKKHVLSHDKLVDYSGIREYKAKQFKQRQARQENQINIEKGFLKKRQGKLNQDNCQNSQYFLGRFNILSKTTTFLNKEYKKGIKIAKNSASHSFLVQHADETEKIKKYRLNYTLSKKGPFIREHDINMNKTAMSFATSKPFDLTTSDFDSNLFKTQNLPLVKQISINYEHSNDSVIKEDKQNTQEQFMDFKQIKNWTGQILMTNPFQHKKQLKKKKKS